MKKFIFENNKQMAKNYEKFQVCKEFLCRRNWCKRFQYKDNYGHIEFQPFRISYKPRFSEKDKSYEGFHR